MNVGRFANESFPKHVEDSSQTLEVNSQTLSTFTCVSEYGFSPQVSMEFDIRVRKFLNPLWIQNHVDTESG